VNRAWLPALALLVIPMAAQAGENGEIRGKLTGPDGGPLADAQVVVTGDGIAGEMEATTDANGEFRINGVPPGPHDIVFLANGMDPARTIVTVIVDQSAYMPIQLKEKTQAIEDLSMDELLMLDTIVVEEKLPVIDTTRSSFSAELGEDLLQNLPVGRSYQEAVNMLPGVAGRVDTSEGGPGDGNPSVRGEGQYGNNYMVDGVSTRDPATKTFGSDVNFDAIEDVQVYTDGAPAEYGQFAGMIVNVVTKDGGDEHHGTAGYWVHAPAFFEPTYPIADLETGLEVPTAKRIFLDNEFDGTFGGPIVKEKLWYFGAIDVTTSQSTFEGMNPDAPDRELGGQGFAKVSWFATPDLTLRLVFNGGTSNESNSATSSQYVTESQSHRKNGTLSTLLTGSLQPDATTDIEIKGGWWSNSLDVTPQSGDEDTPTIYDRDTDQYLGNWTDFDENKRGRLGGGASVTKIVKGAGEHKFKAGLEFWSVFDQRRLRYTGPGEGVRYVASEDKGYPCVEADFSDCYGKTNYKDVGWLGHHAAETSFYLQDDWRVFDGFTVNAGARVDMESLFRNDEKAIPMDDPDTEAVEQLPYRMIMPAPRVGVAWDVTHDSKTLITGFGGQYYDVAGSNLASWADTRSADSFTDFCNRDRATNPNDRCSELGTEVGDPDFLQTHVQDPVGYPSTYSSHLKPARMDKVTLGFEREIMQDFSVGVRGIWSQTVNIPDDVNHDDLAYFIEPVKDKRRDYRGLELTAQKKFDDRWQLMAAYTLSESKGTTPGQFETASGGSIGSDGNNVGVFMDDVGGDQTRKDIFDAGDGAYLDSYAGLAHIGNTSSWYGYLPYQSFHAVKINGSYTFKFGTTLGLVYEFDSGHAWQKRTWVDGYGDYYGFGEGRGTRFMPAVNYIDVRVAHKVSWSDHQSVEATLDIFNLAGFDTPVTYNENDNENFGLTLYRQAPRAVRLGIKGTY
jgi:hypothetical protein